MSPTPSKRVEFIDLLRGWAVIVMIETHVVNATLTKEVMSTDLFSVMKFINGLVAPMFLFASGLAYAVTTRRKLNDYLSFGPPLFRQIARLLFVLIIGYILHIPKFNYEHLVHTASRTAWNVFFQADVLHCIAVSLLFMQLLLLLLRNEKRLYISLAGIAGAIMLATPLVWGIDFWEFLPVPVASYFNGLHYSLFPLFPWSSFVFGGAIVGYAYVEAKAGETSIDSPLQVPRLMRSITLVAGGLFVASFALMPIAAAVYPVYDYWLFSPSFVLLRLALVLFLTVGLYFWEQRRGVSPHSPVTLIGRESLIVYVAHLLMIYGNFGTFNFTDRVAATFGLGEALLTTAVLIVLMYLLALAWSRIKKGPPRTKRTVELAFCAIVLGVFFFGPG
jgi:uncharacterized membrane protein